MPSAYIGGPSTSADSTFEVNVAFEFPQTISGEVSPLPDMYWKSAKPEGRCIWRSMQQWTVDCQFRLQEDHHITIGLLKKKKKYRLFVKKKKIGFL
jgi:hypothetical protein